MLRVTLFVRKIEYNSLLWGCRNNSSVCPVPARCRLQWGGSESRLFLPKILDNQERSNPLVNPDFSCKIMGNCRYTQADGALTVPFTLCKLVDKHRVKFNTFLPFHAGLPYKAARSPTDAKRDRRLGGAKQQQTIQELMGEEFKWRL
ncbi:hypothetical protein D3C74_231420 [compost metagenome]